MSDILLLDDVKMRIGISQDITDYDSDIVNCIEDARCDMIASGVSENLFVGSQQARAVTAIALYCQAFMGDDRSNSDRYMDMYRKRVARLALESTEEGEW